MTEAEIDARRLLADHARQRLAAGLEAELGDSFLHPGGKVDYFTDGIRISGFDMMQRCPARFAHPVDDFEESASNAARRIGRIALRRWQPGLTPAAVVDEAMADTEDWPPGLRQWRDGLDRAGAAVVAAAATTWAVGALRAVRGSTRLIWLDPGRAPLVNVAGRMIQLRGGWDAQRGGARPASLLVVNDSLPGPADRLRCGYEALVCASWSAVAPVSVTIAAPGSGSSRRFVVDSDLLDLGVDRVVEMVGHRGSPQEAPTLAGSWCRHCHLLDDCDDGRAAVAPPA